jgi:uncharacterized small protein (DUF1192 family)
VQRNIPQLRDGLQRTNNDLKEATLDLDDLQPRRSLKAVTLGEPLGALSIPELEERLQALDDERVRVETEIGVKHRAKEAAASMFKS